MTRALLSVGILLAAATVVRADVWEELAQVEEECRIAENDATYAQFQATGAREKFDEAKRGAPLPIPSADYLAESAGAAYGTGILWRTQGNQRKANAVGLVAFARMVPPPSNLFYARMAIDYYRDAIAQFANARERFRHAQQCWDAAAIIYRGQA